MEEPLKCLGKVETRVYLNTDIVINQCTVTVKICPLRNKCWRYISKRRGLIQPTEVGTECGYYMELKKNTKYGFVYY